MTSDEVGRLNSFIEINALINSQYRDFRALLSKIMELAQYHIGCEASSLLLLDAGYLHFEVVLGEKSEAIKKHTVKVGEGIAGWVAQHNRPMIVNDAKRDPRHLSRIGEAVGCQTYNLIAVPLRVKEKLLGVLEAINKKNSDNFTDEDLHFLEVMADQAAITLQNSKSYYGAINTELTILKHQAEFSVEKSRQLLWKSQEMENILGNLEKIAVTDSPILILGESGTGKELIAERIHRSSFRTEGPLIRINCAAIAPGLVESELFGHVKGAFTGAEYNKKGLFEQAAGGTLFLDEVGDIDSSIQVKLLRVLQDGYFHKVGGEETIHTDVRIIAATNKNLKEISIRQDLYYRLAVFTLEIPPLRKRPEDIEYLARQFLSLRHAENPECPQEFSLGAVEVLLTYPWPGNIRELKNAVERATVAAWDKTCIEPEDLRLDYEYGEKSIYEELPLKEAMQMFKKNIIQRALKRYSGNQTLAANALGIQRTYLSRIIRDSSFDNEE